MFSLCLTSSVLYQRRVYTRKKQHQCLLYFLSETSITIYIILRFSGYLVGDILEIVFALKGTLLPINLLRNPSFTLAFETPRLITDKNLLPMFTFFGPLICIKDKSKESETYCILCSLRIYTYPPK